MNELAERALSSAVLATMLLGALYIGGIVFAGLLIVASIALLREFVRIAWKMPIGRTGRIIWASFGVVYIGAAVAGIWQVRTLPVVGLFSSAMLFFIVWATDVGAFITGRLLRGPRIAPSISPSKTWAGLVGGMVAAILVVHQMMGGDAELWSFAVMFAAPLAIVAQAGDFLESWMKRKAGVKDSGSIIPGHGGLFDRLDGLLPVAIVFLPLAKLLTLLFSTRIGDL